jgi:hypothetical protein
MFFVASLLLVVVAVDMTWAVVVVAAVMLSLIH